MRKVCAWCDTVMEDGPEPTSHGLCEECECEQFAAALGHKKPRANTYQLFIAYDRAAHEPDTRHTERKRRVLRRMLTNKLRA